MLHEIDPNLLRMQAILGASLGRGAIRLKPRVVKDPRLVVGKPTVFWVIAVTDQAAVWEVEGFAAHGLRFN
jgi:hypothetical protein